MGHWYTKEGEAMHWIEGANGKQRDTTLRDAKKLGLLPSVTTILGVIDKPALTNWKLKQVTKTVYENAYAIGEMEGNYDAYHKAVIQGAFAKSTDARDRGSEIHDAIENFFLGDIDSAAPVDIRDIAAKAAHEILSYTGLTRDDFIPEQIVVGDGYAGMVDLWADEADNRPAIIIDWKTKDIDDVTKRMAWNEQAMQLAAYEHAMTKHGQGFKVKKPTRHINVFIDRTEPGKVVIHEWEPEEIELAWQKFELLLKYWQLDKNHGAE